MFYKVRFGTNINHEDNYEQAKRLLITLFSNVNFGEPCYSKDYEADADDDWASVYLNADITFDSSESEEDIKAMLKDLEKQMGRTVERKMQGIIDADFDIIV